MGLRQEGGIRRDVPSHPRAHSYSGAFVPERQVTAGGVEQHTPMLSFEVIKGTSLYTITYTVNGRFQYKLENGSWLDDPDGSPITIERGIEDQTLYLRSTLGTLQHTTSIPIAALASGSPTARNVPSIALDGQDATFDTITISWTDPTNLEPGDTYDVVWMSDALGAGGTFEDVSSPFVHERLGPIGHGLDLTVGGIVDDIIYTVLVKSSGGVTVGTSSPLTVPADHV